MGKNKKTIRTSPAIAQYAIVKINALTLQPIDDNEENEAPTVNSENNTNDEIETENVVDMTVSNASSSTSLSTTVASTSTLLSVNRLLPSPMISLSRTIIHPPGDFGCVEALPIVRATSIKNRSLFLI